jgi:hypothetical protein
MMFDTINKRNVTADKEMTDIPFDAMFSGIMGQDYQLLKQISPLSIEMSRLVGLAVAEFCRLQTSSVKILELGGGPASPPCQCCLPMSVCPY